MKFLIKPFLPESHKEVVFTSAAIKLEYQLDWLENHPGNQKSTRVGVSRWVMETRPRELLLVPGPFLSGALPLLYFWVTVKWHHKVSSIALPHLSAIFLWWSQQTMDWILRNQESNQTSSSLNCMCQVFGTSKEKANTTSIENKYNLSNSMVRIWLPRGKEANSLLSTPI